MQAQIDIDKAKALVAALESGDNSLATELLDDLTQQRESELYQQLNQLSEDLHQTLDELDDQSLLMQTKHDMPDAAERLEYVLRTTEEASNNTLDKAEQALQNVEKIENNLNEMGILEVDEELVQSIDAAKQGLTEVMLAQSFQDLTGQVLNRVILIISSVEQSLISLIENSKFNYHDIPDRKQTSDDQLAAEMKGMGPNVTKESKKDTVASQSDVDSLLDDLGI